jgi:hypothetical protein
MKHTKNFPSAVLVAVLAVLIVISFAPLAPALDGRDNPNDSIPDPNAPKAKIKDGVPELTLDDNPNPTGMILDPIDPDGTPPNWDPTDPDLDDHGWPKPKEGTDGIAPYHDPTNDDEDEFDY